MSHPSGYDPYDELEPISSLMSDLSDSEDISAHFHRGLAGRRRKAAVALTVVWSSTIALHLMSWGVWLVATLTTLIGVHLLRLLVAHPQRLPEALSETDPERLPFVSLMVAAKNEEAVIGSLVKMLCNLDYPTSRYELWVIDDNSTDRTPQVLARLQQEYRQLQVFRRGAEAGGGKSGALNQVCPLAKGEILGIFDADAAVSPDLLRRVLPLFQTTDVGAVQVRKAIAQASHHPSASNFLIRGQAAEMALDAFYQEHRIAVGGIGELRGNGQFVRRAALQQCDGWNEETITDDLDLTLRLHLTQWDIAFLTVPAVQEEGVTRAISLWHQRSRWAEGGFQRYLDYWRLLLRDRLSLGKKLDLFAFLMVQYIMPTAAVPDCLMAIARSRMPIFAPLTTVTLVLSMLGMFLGLRRIQRLELRSGLRQRSQSPLLTLLHTLQGTLYMFHWFAVIAVTTLRISIRPKRLKWVKTVHHGGTDELWLDAAEQPE